MKIANLMKENLIFLDFQVSNQQDVFEKLADKLLTTQIINDKNTFITALNAREQQSTTGIGNHIAMPHAKSLTINEPVIVFAKLTKSIDWQSLDKQAVDLVFMICVPDNSNNTHLEAISQLSSYLLQDDFLNSLRNSQNANQVLTLFNQEIKQEIHNEKPQIVAITACPTGIAHTYLAQNALYKAAKELNLNIKVETQGAKGVENELTQNEIDNASKIILAIDKNINESRFAGKKYLKVGTIDAINNAKELLTSNNYQAKQENNLYKHLMSGVSAMLPFVIGGGIMIALAFLLDNLLGVPKEHLGSLGSYNTLANYFMKIGGAAFSFMLPVLAGFIAFSIADKPGLVAGFVAGSIANAGFAFNNLDNPVSSGFLGALIGGFIAGFIINFLKQSFAKLPQSLEGIKSILLYPVFGVLLTGLAMLVVNIPMSIINNALNNFLNNLQGANAVLLGAIVGGMMAVDLGGPINKAAYVFGTGTLATTVANGGSVVMASVMAGGMTPPLAVFLATLIFKNKFKQDELNAGKSNLVMGLSFISEGAIPFAANNPKKVLPAFIVGSAICGGLVAFSNIKLMAPHGGIFVFGLIDKAFLYLIYILIGSLISAVLLSLSRK